MIRALDDLHQFVAAAWRIDLQPGLLRVRQKIRIGERLHQCLAQRGDAVGGHVRRQHQWAAERQATPEQLRAGVQQVRDAWREEVEAIVAMHRDARAVLMEEFSGHRAAVAAKDDSAESLRAEVARRAAEAGATQEAHDRLKTQLADKERQEKKLQQKLTRRDKEAAETFGRLNPGEPMLPNELLSRKAMRAAPPHILLTNYAMLEYLLLRPADMDLFEGDHGSHWQFLVVDEAHVYDGAKAAEVAMLLRRLHDRVALGRSLRYIATSATV